MVFSINLYRLIEKVIKIIILTKINKILCMNDLLLISDYRKAFFFQASSITSGGVITHTAAGTPGNNVTSWTETFTTVSEVIPYQTVTYFLAEGANGQSALFRQETAEPAVEFIPNVANFQVY